MCIYVLINKSLTGAILNKEMEVPFSGKRSRLWTFHGEKQVWERLPPIPGGPSCGTVQNQAPSQDAGSLSKAPMPGNEERKAHILPWI